MRLLGVVMAGGRNTRYGGLKAFAKVGDSRIIDRIIEALSSVTDDIVIIANDADAYAELGLPIRADDIATGAPIAGLLTALRWSAERGADGIIAVACDMPFASGALLRRLKEVAAAGDVDVVAPESGSRRGVEPLCAFYSNHCAAAIDAALARDDLRTIAFYDDVRVHRLPIGEVRAFGDPDVLFMNVNTAEELATAESIAAGQTS